MRRVGIAHFRSQKPAGAQAGRAQSGTGSQPFPGQAASSPHPLADLLHSLKGREIGLLVSGREVEGRLIAFPPVTLVSPEGRVTVVPLERIASVRY